MLHVDAKAAEANAKANTQASAMLVLPQPQPQPLASSPASTARTTIYAVLSRLLASPAPGLDRPAGFAELAEMLTDAAVHLPCHFDSAALARSCGALALPETLDEFRSSYCSIFEIGERGPALPIREELASGVTPAAKEEVVRFYEHFGYELGPSYQWQPDHATVLFEFMHYLCWHECVANSREVLESLRAAQRDFAKRHILNWLPSVANALTGRAGDALLTTIISSTVDFANADYAWLAARAQGED